MLFILINEFSFKRLKKKYVMVKKLLILCITLFLNNQIVNAQDDRFKAVFIFNFAKYLEWPTEYKTGDFVIGILGNSTVEQFLVSISASKSVGSQVVVVKKFFNVESLERCQMLYIPFNNSNMLPAVLNKIGSNSTVIITEKNGLIASGAAFNFVLENGKLGFELNTSTLNNRNLKITNELKELAVKVY